MVQRKRGVNLLLKNTTVHPEKEGRAKKISTRGGGLDSQTWPSKGWKKGQPSTQTHLGGGRKRFAG